jgi:hypothetical protein
MLVLFGPHQGEAESICFKAGILRDMGASREPLQSRQTPPALREIALTFVHDSNSRFEALPHPPVAMPAMRGARASLIGT